MPFSRVLGQKEEDRPGKGEWLNPIRDSLREPGQKPVVWMTGS